MINRQLSFKNMIHASAAIKKQENDFKEMTRAEDEATTALQGNIQSKMDEIFARSENYKQEVEDKNSALLADLKKQQEKLADNDIMNNMKGGLKCGGHLAGLK